MTLFIWSCATIFAQDHILFKNYSLNDGLSQSYVSDVVQDDFGSLWIGTQDGINRFNGKSFEVFTAEEGYDISNQYSHVLKKDQKGNIWLGTYDGLIRYNQRTELFRSFTLPQGERLDVRSISFDQKGNVWVGTAFGSIYKLDEKSGKFEKLPKVTLTSAIIDLHFYDEKLIAVTENEGVLFWDNTFSSYSTAYILNRQYNRELTVNRLIINPENRLLLITNKGAYQYNDSQNVFKSYRKGAFLQMKDQNISDLIYISDKRYFIATDTKGLYQVVEENDSVNIINYSADYFQKGALLSDRINKLYQDKQGVIWISSQRGLSSFDPYNLGLRGVGFSKNLEKGLPSHNVWSFDEDKHANFLFIAGDNGVTRYDKRAHKYEHFFIKSKVNEDVTVLDIDVIDKNQLLVGSYDGLFKLTINDTNSSLYSFTQIPHEIEKGLGFDRTYSILKYHKDSLLLVGTKGGLIVINLKDNSKEYFSNQPSDPNSLGAGPIRLIFKTTDNRYFVSPSSGGIWEVTMDSLNQLSLQKATLFSPIVEIQKDYFTSAIQTSTTDFWFGTLGDGLYHFNTATKAINHYNRSNGLPNNVIYNIQKTPKRNVLWISTNRGLVKFEKSKSRFTTFSEADGLMSDEMNQGAGFQSKTGEIYFGGIMGYNYFDPSVPLTRSSSIEVYFSRLEIENDKILPGESQFLDKSISLTSSIELPFRKRSFNLYFFANDLSNPDRIEYKYRLSGDDNIEENLGTTNQLRFTSLAPGSYTLEIFARNFNGDWNKKPAIIEINVEKPFWLTWWFYAAILVIVGLIIINRVKQSIEKERRQQVKLELKIAERTKEIRAKTEEIEQQKLKLEEQKQELEKEKEKSELLLNNLLPKETASQLKNEGQSAARDFNLVSVMFTDFVGFTGIAENMTAKDLVAILDKFFRKFDEIIDEHDLEKIKTIGDAYMCAGGVPIRNKTNPINTVLAAIRIQDYMRKEKALAIAENRHYWKLRIGINTGPVSAGVIGTKRYAYDVWGKTVNRAQRMERMCEPEKISITEDTFEYIEPYFECINKGKVKTKSGLEINMYEVVSIKPELSENGEGIVPNEAFHKLVNLHFYSKISYSKAERFIMSKLLSELSPKLHYHSYYHSKDVTRQAERIAIGEGITDEDLFLLKTAASYHDAGFIKQYEKNETIGAQMAEEILPNFGYSTSQIKRIKELIYVTEVPHQPKNKLEEIICDADLDYLGRDDFHEISDKLRRELKEHGKIDSDRKWDEMQIRFLEQHRYFTKTSIETRRPKKLLNYEDVKARLERNEYKD